LKINNQAVVTCQSKIEMSDWKLVCFLTLFFAPGTVLSLLILVDLMGYSGLNVTVFVFLICVLRKGHPVRSAWHGSGLSKHIVVLGDIRTIAVVNMA
jgi:hypothetical protein